MGSQYCTGGEGNFKHFLKFPYYFVTECSFFALLVNTVGLYRFPDLVWGHYEWAVGSLWIVQFWFRSVLHLFGNKSTVSNCKGEEDKFLFLVKEPIATGLSENNLTWNYFMDLAEFHQIPPLLWQPFPQVDTGVWAPVIASKYLLDLEIFAHSHFIYFDFFFVNISLEKFWTVENDHYLGTEPRSPFKYPAIRPPRYKYIFLLFRTPFLKYAWHKRNLI